MRKTNSFSAKTQDERRVGVSEQNAQTGAVIATPSRKPGALRGKLKMSSDFDATLPMEIQEGFEAR
jgi:hypothetical protein